MKKLLSMGGIMFLLILSFVLYKYTTMPKIKKGTTSISEASKSLEYNVELFMKKGGEEHHHIESDMNKYDSPEGVIEYLFSVAMLQEVNLVPEIFTYKQFDKDFLDLDVQERVPAIKKALNSLTRNQTLEKIQIIRGMWTFSSNTSRVVVDLYYKDLKKPIRLNIKVKKVHQIGHADTHGSKKEHDIYFIDMSIWEIINLIKQQGGTI